jgi:hypothetical protein
LTSAVPTEKIEEAFAFIADDKACAIELINMALDGSDCDQDSITGVRSFFFFCNKNMLRNSKFQ